MIPLKDQEIIRQKFAQELAGPVKVDLFTEREVALDVPGRRPCVTCKPTREMLQELAGLNDLISLRVHILEEAREDREKFGIERAPATVLRGADSTFLVFYGLPGGTEFPSFLDTIVDVSRQEVMLLDESVSSLREIKDPVTLRVFVTPT
jgi:alkyl hydroperoxide reductase subunit AhpF